MAHPNLVKLKDIQNLDKSELNQKKLQAIENSYDSFEDQLNSRFNPIALDKSTTPYKIIDGRHRVFLARQKGYTSVPAVWA